MSGLCHWQVRGSRAEVAADMAVELTELELEEGETQHHHKKKGAPSGGIPSKGPKLAFSKSTAHEKATVKPKVRILSHA